MAANSLVARPDSHAWTLTEAAAVLGVSTSPDLRGRDPEQAAPSALLAGPEKGVLVGLRPPAGTERLHDPQQQKGTTVLSESDRYEHECSGKRPYPTKQGAKGAGRRLKSFGLEALHLYRCSFCGSWHYGHDRSPRWGGPDAA
jgi:ribosomal protein L32